MIDVEKQIDEVMRKVEFMRGAAQFGSPCDLDAARNDVEATIRTLLSSVQGREQAKSAEAMQAVRNGGCGCCSNACADREDGCRHIHENPSAADMRPAPALEVSQATIFFLKESLQDCSDFDLDAAIAHDIEKILRAASQPKGGAA